ncbi:hypothetical protein HYY71_02110 [Candidatus Woesearchaeota archaeon]|nr:hypothetical protein [Candidatus Woesearchaeota archaeon]
MNNDINEDNNKLICPVCGKILDIGDIICKNCGTLLREEY